MSDGGGTRGAVPGPAAGPAVGASPTGAGVRRRRRRWLRYTAIGVAVIVVGAAGAGWALYEKLNGNITSDDDTAAELARYEKERPTSLVRDAQNILLIGSDSRSGNGNRKYGRDSGTERSDTTILLHLAANRRSATAMSLPRDLMVDVPSCRRPDGTRAEPVFAMFNRAFQIGGSACTIRTVEKLTNIRIDHHMVVDFHGFKDMVDAVDGVEVCLKEPIDDPAAKLRLPAGKVKLNGEQSLGYVRARKTIGDGSDTERMDRQQRFLGALVSKVRSNDVLLNPVKLYPVLDAATSSLTTDPGLASLRGLYDLARGMRDIPTERVQFLTVPREAYALNANRDQLVEPEAEKLFERLRMDAPLVVTKELPDDSGAKRSTVESGGGKGAYGDSRNYAPYGSSYHESHDGKSGGIRPGDPSLTPSPTPTFRGNTAAEDACG
ncbi:LCP family protein [Streptomyces sp. NBC_00878]|uniref:LCP family protein n=1 Tax=Streptomyces sp. NBC_00878 TaxID=2975854 RepID=UPI00224E7A84|nr:LCP family protein [Streptomyces sp. NBC_00878]MCX4908208.1 LCP family protein [Streptomyces sp. NBC_00878]